MFNRSAPPGTMVPHLVYEDVGKAIHWLCGAFGFTERLRTAPGQDGKIGHAQLSYGDGGIMLGGPREGFRPPQHGEVNQSIWVHVEDVDQHFQRATKFGARILLPLKDCEFGERQYTAEDLGGYRWTFSQPIADVAPEEWGAIQAEP